ncbi:MAG: hypothetical protein AB7F19_01640 [Candidatus Babeliales bacterium]
MHTIKIVLKDYLKEESVESILKRAIEANCGIYISEDYIFFEDEKNHAISADIATKKIFKTNHETDDVKGIIIKINNTEIALSFNHDDSNLVAYLTPLVSRSERDFLNGESQKDFARYISLLLTITQDFPLIDIEILYQ